MFAYISETGQRMISAGNMCSADGRKWAHYADRHEPLPLTESEKLACHDLIASNRQKYLDAGH